MGADLITLTGMVVTRAVLMALASVVAATPARAQDAEVVAPFRFTGPAVVLTPMEQQRMLVYRSQLENQLRDLEQRDLSGRLNSLDRRRLSDTHDELGRINNLLLPRSSTGAGDSGNRTLPSLRGGPVPAH